MQVSQLFHSASRKTKMGEVNALDYLRIKILGELTFETQLIPSIFKHNFFINNAELA